MPAIPLAPAPNALYNAEDLQAGTGFVTYYFQKVKTAYILSNIITYSDVNYTEDAAASGNDLFDVDFDIVMNRATTMRGTCIFNVPAFSNSPDMNANLQVFLRKWDGTTETEIATATGGTIQFRTGSSPGNEHMLAASLTVPTTTFKKGESIRVTVIVQLTAGAGTMTMRIFHDPANVSTGQGLTTIPSDGKALLPIKIDV